MKRTFVRNKGNMNNRWNLYYHLMVKSRRINAKFCLMNFMEILGLITRYECGGELSDYKRKKIPKAFTADMREVTLEEAQKYNFYLTQHGTDLDIKRWCPDRQIYVSYTCFFHATKMVIKRLWKLSRCTDYTQYYVFEVQYE